MMLVNFTSDLHMLSRLEYMYILHVQTYIFCKKLSTCFFTLQVKLETREWINMKFIH